MIMLSLSEILFLGIVFYLLYKFVFNFFLPIVKTTRAFRQQFMNMRDTMQDQANPFQRPGTAQAGPQNKSQAASQNAAQPKKPDPSSRTSNNTMGEYIDFEEVK
jgi:hypothetical protein